MAAVKPDDVFFADLKRSTVKTSGGECELPILYKEGGCLGLMYRVDPALARACMGDDTPFEPHVLMGKAIVQLVVFEYRDTTIGPYGEVALAVQVQRKGTSPSTWGILFNMEGQTDYGSLFLNLPVTADNACAAGREIWGYPKYVVGIETKFAEDGIRVVQEGEFELNIGPGGWLKTNGMPFLLFSALNGRVLRTTVPTNHRVQWGGGASVDLKVIGKGPTADNIARLGIADMTPSFTFRTLKMRSILPTGDDLGPA